MCSCPQSQTDRPRILVVEDDPIVQRFICVVLQMSGHEALKAADAVEALIVFQEVAVDAVVTDVRMPGMDGWHLARTLRSIRPDLPILVVSGSYFGGPGSLPVLQKPFTSARLLQVLQGLLVTRR